MQAAKSVPASVGEPIISWRSKGSPDLRGWCLGERVTAFEDLHEGEVYLADSIQFDALNLCRVVGPDPSGISRSLVMATFVSPLDPQRLRLANDQPFAIWDHEIDQGTTVFYRVFQQANASQ